MHREIFLYKIYYSVRPKCPLMVGKSEGDMAAGEKLEMSVKEADHLGIMKQMNKKLGFLECFEPFEPCLD